MKISSKSIFSPARARQPSQISLSTSLSCRLKSGGGSQASPMFSTGGKKRRSGFENPEPSSPKVTCIGQVRVKTKKQGKKMMMRGRSVKQRSFRKSASLVRQSSNGGNGFQSSHRNQRWVHLPFTICEAVRAFGSELSCFLQCNSPCSSSKESKPPAERSSESSCGRWLVAVQDNDGEIEKENGRRRRHVFEGMDFKGENEEESRISICIPPKNALLLMRCRSDPVKMEELAKRFCESPATKLEEEEEEEEEEESKVELNVKLKTEEELSEESASDAKHEKEETNFDLQEEEPIEMATENQIDLQKLGITEQEENRIQQQKLTEGTLAIPSQSRFESEMGEDAERLKSVEEEESKAAHGNEPEQKTEENENGENPTSPSIPETEVDGNWEEEEEVKQTRKATGEGIEPDIQNDDEMGPEEDRSKERETPPAPERETKPEEAPALPECLVLMMYEPKLSMEVSKETWVCSTDFVRCVPTRDKKPPPPPKKKKPANNIAVQPGRWSCSLPGAAAMIEQKVARAKGGYEPFVLTRCKSEPMRSAANLAPDRKLEPHRPAAFGVGAARVGF